MNLYVAQNNQQQGPFTIEEVSAKLADGTFKHSDLAWTQGANTWQPLSVLLGVHNSQPVGAISPPPIPGYGSGIKKDIASLNVSHGWKERFELMERIGWGDGMWKNYRKHMSLSPSERFKIGFNLWAFLFGPFYYFAKGMWGKGALILGAAFVLALLGGVPAFLIPAYCCGVANYHYYRFKVYGK